MSELVKDLHADAEADAQNVIFHTGRNEHVMANDCSANARLKLLAADRITALEALLAEAREVLGRMVANESMVERAHKVTGSPYLNTALDAARAFLAKLEAPDGR